MNSVSEAGPLPVQTRRWRLAGRVQGVGFRPFVYRLALSHGLRGWVQNRLGQVLVCTEGPSEAQEAFGVALLEQAPPLAEPRLLHVETLPAAGFEGFEIRVSEERGEARVHVPPDYFTCDDCLAELNDPADRRYRYPFINCTQCGPRYTLIRALPYDRANTSMADFPLCPACGREYRDPLDRRFHAEPVACPVCGPSLEFVYGERLHLTDTALALQAALQALRRGRIVAVKGVGGYHLMCDARSDAVVARLRERKQRPHKPLAVMFPAPAHDPLAAIAREVELGAEEKQVLQSPMRPVVLARRKAAGTLSAQLAPCLSELGVMLPYSPLHHLLLNDFGAPLVATSGNISGEPVLTDNGAAQARLASVADAFLHHDRPVVRPADDPVVRRVGGRMRPLRLGRGNAPLELALPFHLPAPVLAVGGHMKNTLTLAWGSRAVLSPHIGDMGSARSLAVFEQVAADLQALYGVQARALVCDAHPGYATGRWARATGLPVHEVFHHEAHAAALAGEYGPEHDWLVFTWDGTGLGRDGTLWGGEALAGRPGRWRRVGTQRLFRLPGGERAAREPWRSAVALCWEAGRQWHVPGERARDQFMLHHAWRRQLNAPQSSAVGRLFDAAAALTGVCVRASYEGQGPMQLEALCRGRAAALELPLHRTGCGLWKTDWQPLVDYLLDSDDSTRQKAGRVHATLAAALVAQALRIREEHPVERIGLGGGVFQNRVLTGMVVRRLEEAGFEVCLGERVPANDAGLSFGQVIEYAATLP